MVLKFVSLQDISSNKMNHGTKAVSEGTNTIISTWAQNEKIAILYEVSETKYLAEANVDAVDGESGTRCYSVRLVQNK